ncbi:MAG: LysR substrate-binding domain-containing protein [Hyphomonas sp.]|jgi:LysR family cys regulon transcriptional activator
MILQQLRYLREIVSRQFNISRAADALHTSQPGVSKQIRLLEEELKINIFVRKGGRIVGLSEPGRLIFESAQAALRATENIAIVARDHLEDEVGTMRIAATYSVARYILPPAFSSFVGRYPKVQLSLLEGDPAGVCRMVASGDADIAITTRPTEAFQDLLMLECCRLKPVLITPRKHPLLDKGSTPSLAEISRYRFVTFNAGSLGQSRIQQMLGESGISLKAAFASAMNADIVKSMVEAGLGIAVLSHNTFDPERDPKLAAIDLSDLLEPRIVGFFIRADVYPRAYVLEFMRLLAPALDRRTVMSALAEASVKAQIG